MGFAEDDFGKKIVLPKWNALELADSQQGAIADNQAALPAAGELASSVNLFNQSEMDKMLENAMPGFAGSKGQISGNILDLAKGNIPKDISDMVQRNSAARSLYGGYGGSGAARNLTARDLGLTSLDLTGRGLDAMSRWLQNTTVRPFDVTSMFVTPMQRFSADTQERDAKFQYDYLQAQIDAMPDPATRGIMDAVRAAGVAYLGGNYQTGTDYTSAKGGNDNFYNSAGNGNGRMDNSGGQYGQNDYGENYDVYGGGGGTFVDTHGS